MKTTSHLTVLLSVCFFSAFLCGQGCLPTRTNMDLSLAITGNGSVTINGTTYQAAQTPKTISLEEGISVTLTAAPDDGWIFDHWEEDLAGDNGMATLIMDAEKRVTAVFSQVGLTEEEVMAAIRERHPLMDDAPPIPLPEGLLNSDDPESQRMVSMINEINAALASPFSVPAFIATRAKTWAGGSGQPTYQGGCEYFPFGISVCTWTKTEGDLVRTIKDVYNGDMWTLTYELDGCDGEHEYDHYVYLVYSTRLGVIPWSMTLWNKLHPRAPACGTGELAEQEPVFEFIFEQENEDVLFPIYKYTSITWARVYGDSPAQQWGMNIMRAFPDGSSTMEAYTLKAGTNELFMSWTATHNDNEHSTCWVSYDSDGNITDCGGDLNCYQCSFD